MIGLQRSKTIIKRNRAHHRKPMPRSREELLQCIGQDREVLGAYFQRLNQQKDDANSNGNGNARVADRVASTSATTASPQRNSVASTAATTPSPQRNSYDLFFESACITVKSLPAKLAAEAKSRISQIITEFEIRAISQQEEQQAAQMRRQKNFDDIGGGVEYEFHSCP
ncbi:hypothetical protein KR018_005709 [Drosophila ironensis]|nr:hypothetical protein KR018_005709 [Drosophila ironensis]